MKVIECIKKMFSSPKNNGALTFRVKCPKCHEIIEVRVDISSDLINEYKDSNEPGPAYTLKKEVLGNKCNHLMKLVVAFDENYNIISQTAEGGDIVS
jgi:hypothetical protein